jgi:hypothetical protein
LNWDINKGYRSTILTGRLDWDINTAKTLHSTTTEETKHNRSSTHRPHSCGYRNHRSEEPPLIEEKRGMQDRTKRATTVEDPTPQCCCTETDRPTAWRTPSPKLPKRAGASRIHRWTPLSRTRGPSTLHLACLSYVWGPPNPPHGSTLLTRLKNCCRVAGRGAPPPETYQVADHSGLLECHLKRFV